MLALLPAGLTLAALLLLTIGAAALALLAILVRAASLLTLPVLIFLAIRHAGLLLTDAHRDAASRKITDGEPVRFRSRWDDPFSRQWVRNPKRPGRLRK